MTVALLPAPQRPQPERAWRFGLIGPASGQRDGGSISGRTGPGWGWLARRADKGGAAAGGRPPDAPEGQADAGVPGRAAGATGRAGAAGRAGGGAAGRAGAAARAGCGAAGRAGAADRSGGGATGRRDGRSWRGRADRRWHHRTGRRRHSRSDGRRGRRAARHATAAGGAAGRAGGGEGEAADLGGCEPPSDCRPDAPGHGEVGPACRGWPVERLAQAGAAVQAACSRARGWAPAGRSHLWRRLGRRSAPVAAAAVIAACRLPLPAASRLPLPWPGARNSRGREPRPTGPSRPTAWTGGSTAAGSGRCPRRPMPPGYGLARLVRRDGQPGFRPRQSSQRRFRPQQDGYQRLHPPGAVRAADPAAPAATAEPLPRTALAAAARLAACAGFRRAHLAAR